MSALRRLGLLLNGRFTPDGRVKLAERAGVPGGIAHRAAAGKPISADSFLRLCAVLGLDPVSGDPCAPSRPGRLDFALLAMGVSVKRHELGLNLRTLARRTGLSPATLSRVGNHAVSVESALKLCAFVGVHPTHYVATHAVAEQSFTGNQDCNTLQTNKEGPR